MRYLRIQIASNSSHPCAAVDYCQPLHVEPARAPQAVRSTLSAERTNWTKHLVASDSPERTVGDYGEHRRTLDHDNQGGLEDEYGKAVAVHHETVATGAERGERYILATAYSFEVSRRRILSD